MAKIILQGENLPIAVTEEEAVRILNQKNDPKYKSLIRVANRDVQKGRIREVVFGTGSMTRKYNLDVPDDRTLIKEFEKSLTDRAAAAVLVGPLEVYGASYADYELNHPEARNLPGFVFNPLLGLVHWSTVQLALDENIISTANKGKYWSIVSHGIGDQIDTTAYDDFYAKLKSLRELQDRRRHSQNKDLEALSNQRDAVVEQLAMPAPLPL